MRAWIKVVEPCDLVDGKAYFLGRPPANEHGVWLFVARDIKGKSVMSQKPGIAVRYLGGDSMRAVLEKHSGLRAIEVPADAATRWKRRTRRFL